MPVQPEGPTGVLVAISLSAKIAISFIKTVVGAYTSNWSTLPS